MKRIDFDKKRYPAKTLTPKEWSKQRIAAAKRALKKEKERAGLFPELMRFNSAEERMEQADSNFLERVVFYRKKIAEDLKQCKKEFRALPEEIKKSIVKYWKDTYMPKEPFRLLGLINEYKKDSLYFERMKGNASKFTETVISYDSFGTKISKIVEITNDKYWSNLQRIDEK